MPATRSLRLCWRTASIWSAQLQVPSPARGLRAGAEEPNALCNWEAALTEPNARATAVELYEGLSAASQNCWPSVRFDLWALNDLLAPLFPAGFYYKTFMWPQSWWRAHERMIRRAGAGQGATRPRSRSLRAHARALRRARGRRRPGRADGGARRRPQRRARDPRRRAARAGRRCWPSRSTIRGRPGCAPHGRARSLPELRVLTRTTAFGYYDHNFLGCSSACAITRRRAPPRICPASVCGRSGRGRWCWPPARSSGPGVRRERPAGHHAGERGAGLCQPYAVGRAAARSFTNNDSAYRAALDLQRAGVGVSVVDLRPDPQGSLPAEAAPPASASSPAMPSPGPRGVAGSRRSRCAAGDAGDRGGGRRRDHPVRSPVRLGRLEPDHPPALAVARRRATTRSARCSCPASRSRRSARPAPATARSRCAHASSRVRAPAGSGRGGGFRRTCRSCRSWTTLRRRPRAGVAGALGPAGAAQQDVRRPAERRHRRRHPARARRGLPLDRARQALHHAGMGTDQGKTANVNALGIVAETTVSRSPPSA